MGKPDNLYFISNYKRKKKRAKIIQDAIYELCMSEIVEVFYAVEEIEAVLREIEKEHGMEILEDVWNSLSEEEQRELRCTLRDLRKKISNIKKKTTSFDKSDKSS